VSATFVLNNSLAAGLSNEDIKLSGLVASFSAFDGRSTFETSDLKTFIVTTDASGSIVEWEWTARFDDSTGATPNRQIYSAFFPGVVFIEEARFVYNCGVEITTCEPSENFF